MTQQQPVLVYDRIDQNRRNTFFLMFLFVLLVAGFATAIGIVVGLPPQYAAIVAVPVLLFALFSYYASTRITLAISGARPITKQDEPELYRTVENLCIGAGLPMPQVYVIEDGAPNAFATGRDPNHAASSRRWTTRSYRASSPTSYRTSVTTISGS